MDGDARPLAVSQLIGMLRGALAQRFGSVRVRGEIASFSQHASGHLYFTLKDRHGQLRCMMYRDRARRLHMTPSDGLQVVLAGAISIYTERGELQLRVDTMEPDGLGQLFEALELLKLKLTSEGLFAPERKRALPFLPRRVAVVTSPQGAVLHDIHTTLRRRNPAVELLCAPALVQGPEAPRQIVRALARILREGNVDCVILARGGGSLLDLMPFNHEGVVRSLSTYPLPLISAVGHETDHTLCDLVADRRAPTPTAAAEMVAPSRDELLAQLKSYRFRCHQALRHRALQARAELSRLSASPWLRDPLQLVDRRRAQVADLRRRLPLALDARERAQRVGLARLEQRLLARHPQGLAEHHRRALNDLRERLQRAAERRLDSARTRRALLVSQLELLSPLRILERGYALCLDEKGRPIASVTGRKPGDSLEVRLHDGLLGCKLETISTSEGFGASAEPKPTPG